MSLLAAHWARVLRTVGWMLCCWQQTCHAVRKCFTCVITAPGLCYLGAQFSICPDYSPIRLRGQAKNAEMGGYVILLGKAKVREGPGSVSSTGENLSQLKELQALKVRN